MKHPVFLPDMGLSGSLSAMRNPRIYTPQPLSLNAQVELSEEAANHVGKVLRMKQGEPLVLFNGEGGCYQGTIDIRQQKTCQRRAD